MEITVKIKVIPFEIIGADDNFSSEKFATMIKVLNRVFVDHNIKAEDFARIVKNGETIGVFLLSGFMHINVEMWLAKEINYLCGGTCSLISEERYNEIYEPNDDDYAPYVDHVSEF